MTKADMEKVMNTVFAECHAIRNIAHEEYAHAEDSFANFKRIAERLNITPEQALLVYFEKHVDGIHAWAQGIKAQRESVKGRINDCIVYLCLLRGMVEEVENHGRTEEG